jgi:hypothetical protein
VTIKNRSVSIAVLPYDIYIGKGKGKGKSKVRPRRGHECPEGQYVYSSTISLTSALGGVGG